jgi:hypothetical protein
MSVTCGFTPCHFGNVFYTLDQSIIAVRTGGVPPRSNTLENISEPRLPNLFSSQPDNVWIFAAQVELGFGHHVVEEFLKIRTLQSVRVLNHERAIPV